MTGLEVRLPKQRDRGLAVLLGVLIACAHARVRGEPPSPSPPTPSPSPSETVRFFALGDTGTGLPDEYKVASAIAERCQASGCDFGVLLGDNFYPDGVTSTDDPQWASKFEQPYSEVIGSGIPIYAVLGNHDYADGRDMSRGAHQVAYSASHPHWRMPAAHYSFTHGEVAFVALDTQRIVSGDAAATSAQRALVADALSGGTRWLVGLGHHPYVSNGTNGNAPRRLAGFLEEKLCRAADLYLAGHDHSLQVLEAPPRSPCRALFVVSGGGGYETYATGGPNAAAFQAKSLGFAYVSVEPARLRVHLYDAEGALLFRREVQKDPG